MDMVKDAELYELQRDIAHEAQAQAYSEAVTASINSLNTFKSFLWDIDTDGHDEHAILQLFHGVMDESPEDQLYAYSEFMGLFERYCNSLVEV